MIAKKTLLLTALTGLVLSTSACKTKNQKPDTDTTPAETQTKTESTTRAEKIYPTPEEYGAWTTIPELKPLTLSNADPKVEELGEEQGVFAYKVGELMVLHKPTPANQIVSTQLFFLGGAQRLTEQSTGIESFALSVAADGGTETTPKDDFNAKLDSMGASIGSFTGRDDSGVAMQTILPFFDDTWELFVQSVFEPAMPEDVVELTRKQMLARIDSMLESADSHVSHLATQAMFKGHPYESLQLGTRETVSQLSRDELRAWQRELLQPNQMLLVVVGNVNKDDLLPKIQKSFGRLESSRQPLPALPVLKSGSSDFVFDKRDLPTHYIFGLFEAPHFGDADFAPMVVAMEYLSDRLFEEVRTKRNLTYAVSAGISSSRANYGYLYVTAVDPKTTLGVMLDTLKELKTTPLDEQAIKETLNVYITNRYMGQETNSSQAAALAYSYYVTGDWRQGLNFVETLQKVTPADVQRVVNTYAKDFHFAAVGPDESSLPKKLMAQ